MGYAAICVGAVHGGSAFAGILYLRAGKESVCGQPDCAADYVSSRISAVGISVFNRADADRTAMDHAHLAGAVLRFSVEENLSQGNARGYALCGFDSIGCLCVCA